MSGKEMWFREMERLLSEKEDAGIPFDRAYEQAGTEAHGAVQERIADMADEARMRRKEQGGLSEGPPSAESASTKENG